MEVDSIRGTRSVGSVTSTTRRRAAAAFDVNIADGPEADGAVVTAVTESSASHAYSEDDSEPASESLIDVDA